MTFLKNHWFGFILSLIVGFFALVFLIVLFAPRQDLQKRGFIPCTDTMAGELLDCSENKAVCMLGAVLKNSWCDAGVVYAGVKNWLTGSQVTPWANYYFTPELPTPTEEDSAELQEFYGQTPDVGKSMRKLIEQNRELEETISREETELEQQNKKEESKGENQDEQ